MGPPAFHEDPTQDDDSEDEEAGGSKKSSSIWEKIANALKFAWKFLEVVLDKVAVMANSTSRDYRYVAHVLDQEKRKLKAKKKKVRFWGFFA